MVNLLRAAAAHELRVQSAAPRRHVRRIRERHPRALRDRPGGHQRTRSSARMPMARIRIQGQTRRSAASAHAQIAPYHLRLDWLMWFAALSPRYAEPWFRELVERLLRGDPRCCDCSAGIRFPTRRRLDPCSILPLSFHDPRGAPGHGRMVVAGAGGGFHEAGQTRQAPRRSRNTAFVHAGSSGMSQCCAVSLREEPPAAVCGDAFCTEAGESPGRPGTPRESDHQPIATAAA